MLESGRKGVMIGAWSARRMSCEVRLGHARELDGAGGNIRGEVDGSGKREYTGGVQQGHVEVSVRYLGMEHAQLVEVYTAGRWRGKATTAHSTPVVTSDSHERLT